MTACASVWLLYGLQAWLHITTTWETPGHDLIGLGSGIKRCPRYILLYLSKPDFKKLPR